MKIRWLFVLLLIAISSLAQTKETYVDGDLNQIAKTVFDQNDLSRSHYRLRVDLDTLIAPIKVQRNRKGKLAPDTLKTIKSLLAKSTGQTVPDNHTLAINYHHGPNACLKEAHKPVWKYLIKKYYRKLEKLENVSSFFLYNQAEGLDQFDDRISWTPDPDLIITQQFFPIHYPCGSFVLIDPDGNYYLNRGEYHLHRIIDLLRVPEDTFSASSIISKD
ncbi:hypothetical protein [Croceiramulus getboli]|nr:hypothetical protein P8624_00175 [Flavobacteriaceae bacterium YJPT1-3]